MNFNFEITEEKIDTYKNLLIRKDSLKKEAELIWFNYIRELGDLVETMYKSQIDCIVLRKKIAYCQAKRNRSEAIIADELETIIETELSDYFDELAHIQSVKNSKFSQISDYELLQIKKLYRKIATMIHPDLHPRLFKEAEIQELWNKAKTAYLANNYNDLKEAEFLISQAIKKYTGTDNKTEIEDIDEKIQSVNQEIEKIVSSSPYQYKFILADEELLKEERSRIENEIEQYQNYFNELNEILSQYDIKEVLN